MLARFEAFCRAEFPGLGTVTRASAEAWITAARQRGVQPATLQGLAAPVRELARWLGRRGTEAYVLPAGVLPRPARYVPHIYTDQELAALFAQTDRCRCSSEAPFRHLVMPVLFRTIYACGLRASEARLLRPGDVDTAPGSCRSAMPRAARTGRCPSPGRCCERLAGYRAQAPGSRAGTGSSPAAARPAADPGEHLQELPPVPLAGPHLPRRAGPRPPRPRPAAHFRGQQPAVVVRQGEDVGALLPVLQAYMGHSSISDTAYYLRLTAESYPQIAARVQRELGDVVPPTAGRAGRWRLTSRSPCAAS